MRNFKKSKPNSFVLACAAMLLTCGAALAQTTSFTYQGRLADGGTPANGNYDLQFALFDNSSGGAQIGSTQTIAGVSVGGGVFTVQLDFGVKAFPGANRFLEIGVRPAGVGSFTVLSPRQQISSTPYAIRTLSAATADTAANATQLGGVAASQYVQTTDARLSDARAPTAGSPNYIQSNPAAQQAGASFNISGSGTAGGTLSGNTVNSATQFNIGGNRVLSVAGTNNVFAGPSAGQANTSGSGNAFVGAGAGQANTVGINNSFFGLNAGAGNVGFVSQLIGQVTTGKNNSFFGVNAGKLLPQSTDNSFFGANAGGSSTQGDQNSFFGSSTGSVSTGNANSFFGVSAGAGNNGSRNSFFGVDAGAVGNGGAASGDDNAFFGTFAGENNKASGNAFFGSSAGMANTTGNFNSFFGFNAGSANTGNSGNSFFGSGAGANIPNNNHNSLFGAGAGGNITCCEDNSFFGFQAGQNAQDTSRGSFFGFQAGQNTTNGTDSFFGYQAGQQNTLGFGNSFFGYQAGLSNINGTNNTLIGRNADVASGGFTNATAIGANAKVACSHCLILGDSSDSQLSVGIGTNNPTSKLEVRGNVFVTSDGEAVEGLSSSRFGVHGVGYFGVLGRGDDSATNNTGFPFSFTGVVGESTSGIGVVAVSDTGFLMAGVSGNGTTHPYAEKFHILNNGTYVAGSDFAEALPARGGKNAYEPGDVLVLSGTEPGAVEKSSRPYDTRAAGVYSTRPGVLGADKQGATRVDADDLPVAIIGVVPTKVSAENGPIQIGDLLTTSATPGYAMRCDDRLKCLGAVVGKAMEALAEGKRTMKVLVTLK